MNELVTWSVIIAAGGTAGEVLRRWVVMPLVRFFRKLDEFLSDWRGELARPGRAEQPGVMSRLERIEWHVGNGDPTPLREVVDSTAGELRDQIDELNRQLKGLEH